MGIKGSFYVMAGIIRNDRNRLENTVIDFEEDESVWEDIPLDTFEETYNTLSTVPGNYQHTSTPGLRHRRPVPNYGSLNPQTSGSSIGESSFNTTNDSTRPLRTRRPTTNNPRYNPFNRITSGVSTLSAGEKIATGAGAVTAGVALGAGAYGISKLLERTEKKGAVLPYSDFIGPGNPIPIGAAKSPQDQVAKKHDLEYEEISHKRQKTDDFNKAVKEADIKAINEFDAINHWQAKIGATGLRIKQTVEGAIGHPLYPVQGK